MMNTLKNKKGFTLVELIVVLVILAILAALLIPALTGYIDEAKEKQIIAETRMVVMAAQTVVSENYGADDTDLYDGNADKTKIAALAEIEADAIKVITLGTDSEAGTIAIVVYQGEDSYCTYTEADNTYVVTKGTYTA